MTPYSSGQTGRQHGGRIVFCNVDPTVTEVFRASRLESLFGFETDRSTTGGTSDARFIRALCPVVEFGLVGTTMHQINECVPVADLEALTDAYEALIRAYFARFSAS